MQVAAQAITSPNSNCLRIEDSIWPLTTFLVTAAWIWRQGLSQPQISIKDVIRCVNIVSSYTDIDNSAPPTSFWTSISLKLILFIPVHALRRRLSNKIDFLLPNTFWKHGLQIHLKPRALGDKQAQIIWVLQISSSDLEYSKQFLWQ